MQRYKVPIHINTPDKILFGLTTRQVLLLLLGASLSYSIWLHLFWLRHLGLWAQVLQLVFALPPAVGSLPLAFLSLADRHLELWFFAWLRYQVSPRQFVWHNGTRERLECELPPTEEEENER